jgi:hypothetical protein
MKREPIKWLREPPVHFLVAGFLKPTVVLLERAVKNSRSVGLRDAAAALTKGLS